MKVVAVVPMKLNNERLPNKNTKKFSNGKILCSYILNTLLEVKLIDEIYVYCSDERILEYIPNGINFLKRETIYDTSDAKMNEILKNFAKEVDADLYIMSHATSPFIKSKTIEDSLQKVISNKYDSALTVTKLEEFIWKDNKAYNYDLSSIPRTQDLEKLYSETSGMYIYNKNTIINHNRRIGFKPYLKVVDKIEAVDIDEDIDFIIADAINEYILEKNK